MKHKLKNIIAFTSVLSICVFSTPKIQYVKALDKLTIEYVLHILKEKIEKEESL